MHQVNEEADEDEEIDQIDTSAVQRHASERCENLSNEDTNSNSGEVEQENNEQVPNTVDNKKGKGKAKSLL